MTTGGCRDFEDLIADHAEGALDESRRWPIEAHLSECAACRAALAELRWIDQVLARSLNQADPAGLLAPAAAKARCGRPRLVLPRPIFAASVATIIFTAALGWFAWRRGGQDRRFVAGGDLAPLKDRSSHGSSGPRGRLDGDAGTGGRKPQAAEQLERRFAELKAAIDRETGAAQLAAAAEVLAAEPTVAEYARESLRYLAAVYPDTVAGRAAAERLTTGP